MLIMKQYGQIPEIMQTEQSAQKPAEANRHDGGRFTVTAPQQQYIVSTILCVILSYIIATVYR